MAIQLGSAYGKITIDGSGVRAGANEAEGALSRFQRSARSILEFATGQLVARGFQAIGSGLSNMARDAINSASSLQDLSLALETLVAREAVAAGEAESIEDALAGVGPVAEDLMGRLEDLSIVSPFEYEQVAATFRTQMAFGATSDAAMDLTGAILDTGAALGVTGEHLDRMNYNLAQALIQGDLTAANLRQLRGVGLDLAGVLESRLGRSMEQIRDDLESGALTMEEVSQAFIEYTDENFGGASERMSRTFTGLKSSINDLFFFAGADLLTPSLERITDVLGDVFDRARAILDSGVFERIGEQLAEGVDWFFTVAGRAVEGLRDLYQTFHSGGLRAVLESFIPSDLIPAFRFIFDRVIQYGRAFIQFWRSIIRGFGDLVAGDLGGALENFRDAFLTWLNWITELGRDLVTVILEFFRSQDWGAIGRTVLDLIKRGFKVGSNWAGEQLTVAWEAITTFFSRYDWQAIGRRVVNRIGEGLRVTGTWASEQLMAAKEAIISFFTETDWMGVDILGRIGESISGAASNINLGGSFDDVMGFLSGGGGGGVNAVAGLATTFGLLPGPIGTAIGVLRLFAQAWTNDVGGIQERFPAALGAVRDAGGRVSDWITGTAIPRLREWYDVFRNEILPVLQELATTGLSQIKEAGQQVWGWITDTAIPILKEWYDWFSVNIIPVFREMAQKVLRSLWDRLREVWDWIKNDGASTLEQFGESMRRGPIAAALRFATFVLRLLIAYSKAVWSWIIGTAIPTIQRWGTSFRKGLQPYLERIMDRLREFYSDIRPRLQNALRSLRDLWDQLKDSFARISTVWNESLGPALDRLAEALGFSTGETDSFFESLGQLIGFILQMEVEGLLAIIAAGIEGIALAADIAALALESITLAIEAVGEIIDGVIEGIGNLASEFEDLTGVDLPDWLTPGSPTPFELGLRGIADAIRSMPNLSRQMAAMTVPVAGMIGAGGSTYDYRDQRRSMAIYGGVQAYGQEDPKSFVEQLWEISQG